MVGPINIATEGYPDEVVAYAILDHLGLAVGNTYACGGKVALDRRLHGFNAAANFSHWLVLRDLDHDADCAPMLVRHLIPDPNRFMSLRVPVREIEAWLLSDRERFSEYFHVPLRHVPENPEQLEDPKAETLRIVRGSRRREIRESMVPRPNSGASEGPGYATRIAEYAFDAWRPSIAAMSSTSLQRCINHLRGWCCN